MRHGQREGNEELRVPEKPHAKKEVLRRSQMIVFCLVRAAVSPPACPLLSHLPALPPNYTLSIPGRGREAAGRVLLGSTLLVIISGIDHHIYL